MGIQEIPQPKTAEDIINSLAAWAQEKGDDFRVKVLRRVSLNTSQLPVYVTTLDGAKLHHISSPEPWLQDLAGGGNYILQVYPPGGGAALGALPVAPIQGDPKLNIDVHAVDSPTWRGPGMLVGTSGEVLKSSSSTSSPTQPLLFPPPSPSNSNQQNQAMASAWAAKEEALAAREKELLDRTHRLELEAIKRQADEKYNQLERKMTDLIEMVKTTQSRPVETAPQKESLFDKLLPTLMDMGREMIRESREAKKETLTMQLEMQKAMMTRPIIPPEIKELIERGQASAAEQAKMMGGVYDAMGNMSRNMIQTIASIADLQLGNRGQVEEGFNWTPVIKTGLETLGNVIAKIETMKHQTAHPQPPPAPVPPPRQLPPKPQPSTQLAAPPVPPVQSSEVVNPTETQVQQEPKKMEEEDDDDFDPRSTVQQVVDALKNKVEASAVVAAIKEALPEDPELQQLFNTVFVDQAKAQTWLIENLGLAYLTDGDNRTYLETIFKGVQG